MNNGHHTFRPSKFPRRALAALTALALFSSCAHREGQVAPIPMPAASGDHVDIQGVQVTASAYTDSDQAETAFGFDIVGAGLLPVRVGLDNQSTTVVKVNPQQTFLIDMDGQAWPILSAEQAYNRAAKAVELGTITGEAAKSAVLLGTAGAIGSFALAVVLSRGIATPVAQGAIAGASLGALTGGTDAVYGLENKVRGDLSRKALRNQRIQPGEMAYGVLFFPARDEARGARNVRLALELDGYPQIATLPLKIPPAPR